jgi:hypothetical protein
MVAEAPAQGRYPLLRGFKTLAIPIHPQPSPSWTLDGLIHAVELSSFEQTDLPQAGTQRAQS